MTDDLDTLRPEVQQALAWLKSGVRPGTRSFDGWSVIRAELLRLAGENAQLHESAQGGYEDGWHALRNERDTLRAELAAIKARIAEAPVCDAEWVLAYGLTFIDAPIEFDGKTMRLVVEE